MPIITLGTTEPEAIIVETGTLPDNFYSTLQNDVEMQDIEPVDIDTKASLITSYMNDTETNVDRGNTNNDPNKAKQDGAKNGRQEESNTDALKVRSDLLEFAARADGSVNCKLCGKIFASRQHWYRHKYRAHVVLPPMDPLPLNECNKCHIFFKSRKGYLGHMSSKHSETLQDATPIIRNDQATAGKQETMVTRPGYPAQPKAKKDLATEMPILKTVLQSTLALPATPAPPAPAPSRNTSRGRGDKKKTQSTARASDEMDPKEYQERRVKEESFVLDIIEKVRRQCETEPESANRRGYTRKTV